VKAIVKEYIGIVVV